MAANPTFDALLDEIRELHQRKNQDYAGDVNPYANFEFAARWAKVPVDKVFEVMIGIKYARLDTLLEDGREPNFESVEDTQLDIVVYSGLRLSYWRDHPVVANPVENMTAQEARELAEQDLTAHHSAFVEALIADIEEGGIPVDLVFEGESTLIDPQTWVCPDNIEVTRVEILQGTDVAAIVHYEIPDEDGDCCV